MGWGCFPSTLDNKGVQVATRFEEFIGMSHPRISSFPPTTRKGLEPALKGVPVTFAFESAGLNVTLAVPISMILMEVLRGDIGLESDIWSSPWTKIKGVRSVDL